MTAIIKSGVPPEWNLSDLYVAPDDPRIETDITCVARESQAFEARYRTHVGDLSASA